MLFIAAFTFTMLVLATWSNWLLLWPGTAAHELNHYLAGVIFDAEPRSVRLLPRDGVLGEVTFAGLSGWNALPVALAPLISTVLVWLSWGWLCSISTSWLAAVMGWITASVIVQSWPSRQDFSLIREYWLGSTIWTLAITALLYASLL